MASIGVLCTLEGGNVGFHCPGCNSTHVVRIQGPGAWYWNGSHDRPTFAPSVLIRSGHYLPEHKPGDRCWCTYRAEHPDKPGPFVCEVCHSFVKDGEIQFLDDCTHALAGQTVPLKPFGEA
jgi:hypothetical protein